MADQKVAVAAATNSDTHNTITLSEGHSAIDVSTADIQNMIVNDQGALVITLKSGGEPLVIENFRELAQSNTSIELKDGKSLDTHSLYETLAGKVPAQHAADQAAYKDEATDAQAASTAANAVNINRPHAGEMVTVDLGHGHNYILKADLTGAHVVEKGGALVITFADNGILILQHFDDAMKGADASHIVYNDKMFDLAQFQNEFHLANGQIQVSQNNQDALAKQLAGVEPAAGPNGGGGGGSAGGYGFQSSVDPASLFGRPPIGPIGPTELRFGLPQFDQHVFPNREGGPDLSVNHGPHNHDPNVDVSAPPAIVKEDHAIFVPIQAALDLVHGSHSQVLTVKVTGLDSTWTITNANGTYDAATGTWTVTLAPGKNYNGGLTFAPPANADLDMDNLHVTASAYDPATGKTVTVAEHFDVITDAVADTPIVAASNGTVEAGHSIALNITTAVTDTDGSETITHLTVDGLPPGATLNHGTVDSHGVWTLSPADLTGLTITVPKADVGTYTLNVTTYNEETNLTGDEVDFSDNNNHASTTLTLEVTPNGVPVIAPPAAQSVDETNLGPNVVTGHVTVDAGIDGPAPLTANGTFTSDGSEKNNVLTSNGETVTVDHTGNTYTGTNPAGDVVFSIVIHENGDYTFTQNLPLDHADGKDANDVINLHFGITATDSDGDTDTSTITIKVVDDAPIAHDDTNSFYAHAGSTTGNVVTGMNEAPGGADTLSHDVPNTVTSVTFGTTTVAVPATGTVSIAGDHGTLTIGSDGSYTYAVNGTITAEVVDKFTYNLIDGDGDNDTADLNIDIKPDPTIILIVNHSPDNAVNAPDALVKEDHSVTVPVEAHLNNPSTPTEALTVVVTGIPSTVGTVTAADGGVYDAAHGTITWTLAPGQALNSSITFTPNGNSDIDFGQLQVTATASDAVTGTVSATTGLYVTTDAVADVPLVSAAPGTVEGGHTIPLTITSSVTDTDGSEKITHLTVEGLPPGATLNHGTVDSHGVWTLSPADLTGLTITVPKADVGTYNLNVTTYNEETVLSGKEPDLSDNTNHASTTLVLTVTPNGVPVIVPPDVKSVDETNLVNTVTGTSVSGHVTADYGVDGPGKISTSNSFTSGGSETGGHLTSNGQAVTVTETATGYIGTAGGATVFTMTIGENGDYTFTQFKTLDHADGKDANDVINLNFGIKATDADGDSSTSTITVKVIDDAPVAHDDVNHFYANVGHTSGNVITGAGELPGGADTLSHDTFATGAGNHVTQVKFGTTVVDVPETGTATIEGAHGTLTIAADGSYTYVSNGSSSTTTVTDTPHVFTGNKFPTDLSESHAIGTADQAAKGELHANMAVTANTTVSGQITFDGAGYTNSLGAFTITADGTIQAAQMVAPSITGTGASFTMNTGAGATELGFFIVADGATNNHIDYSKGSLSFVYDYGKGDERAANVNDAGAKVSLVFTDGSGHETVLQGPVYFTTDRGGSNSLNGDGVVHTISGVDGTDTSTLKIGFEDLPNGGDKDYNDVVFGVKLTDHTVTDCGCGADQFTYTLTDSDGDTDTANLNLDCIKSPTVDITVNNGAHDAVVKEDHSITVPVTAHLNNPSSAGESLTVTVSGIPSGVGTVTAANGGVYDAAHGTVTWTLAPGQSLNSSITFTPNGNSDVDFGNLHATATATDSVTGTVSSTVDFSVITDAVADVPTLTASAANGEAGHTIPLVIHTGVTDTDGSESITKVTIEGLPAGATLNHGTVDSHGVWTLSVADLTGLTIAVPKADAGKYNLTVTSYNEETKLSGTEVDYTDNTNHATTTLVLTTTPNGVPCIVAPDVKSVDETNLGPVSINGHVSADYGVDGPGKIAATGVFTSGGSETGGHLTSGGSAVTVSQNGNVYTGTTANGDKVFTLTIQDSGDYTFTLLKTLDHADGSNPNDVISLNFGVKATDADGDSANTTITVKVLDDAPIAHNDVNTFDGTTGHTSGNVVTGVNEVAGGADTLSHDTPNTVTKVTFGSTSVDVPATGTATIHGAHGTLVIKADGSYTYTLDHAAGTTTSTPHVFTGNKFPTDLSESHAISTADKAALGEAHSNMAINADTVVTGHITFDGAGYTNSLGAFTIDANGNLQAAQMVATQITGPGADFSVNAANGATELGFFLVANGYNTNNGYSGLDFSHGTLKFVYDYGKGDARVANINDDGNKVSLVLTDTSGHDHVISGPIYYTTDRGGSNSLNPDCLVHTISGTDGTDTSTLKIGFEDLPQGGDKDYNDTVFTVQLTDHTVACGCGDTFGYTLTDSDGDSSNATLALSCDTPLTTTLIVNNGADCAVVKEDHSIFVAVNASTAGDGTQHLTTLLVTGIAAGWGVAGGWVATGNAGEYKLTLPAGTTSYNGGITLTPPANSDADLPALHFTANAADNGGHTANAGTDFAVITDAVVDTPTLTVPGSESFTWSPSAVGHWTKLPISSHVTDTDGSEQVQKIVVNLNNSFTNPKGGYDSLADMGVTLNKGVETSHGVWTITVNAKDAASALNGLALSAPTPNDHYTGKSGTYAYESGTALHGASHSGSITVQTYVAETNLSGQEKDYTDNTIVVTKEICYTFAISPLVVDLNHDGFNIVGKEAGIRFDMTNDGLADHTSWVGAQDGMLAIDANHNGVIDNQSELFGDSNGNATGFDALAALDSNHDGVIDAKDADWSKLQIWQDANQDGISQANELHGLSDHGIESISLSTVSVNDAVSDTTITDIATVTFTDGHTSQIGDAWFNVSDAQFDGVGVRIDGSQGNDSLYGTADNDVLAGHGGNDVLFGGTGADVFAFDTLKGVAVVEDFNHAEGDSLDLSALLQNFDPVTDAINHFVFATEVNGNTVVSVDQTGSGDVAHATQVAVLQGVTGLTADELIQHHIAASTT